MNWLEDSIARLANCKSHNCEDYFDAHYEASWNILCATSDDLEPYVLKIWEAPVDQLPIPLKATIAKHYALDKLRRNEFSTTIKYALDFLWAHGHLSEDKSLWEELLEHYLELEAANNQTGQ